MNLNELKKLMGDSGRCVIVENDKPAHVIMTAKDFLALSENKAAEPALPILSPTKSELQNRGSSISQPNQKDLEEIGTKPSGGEKQSVVEPVATASSGAPPTAVVGKESYASFVKFEDAGEAIGLQDITFEDLGIDELPD